MRWTGRRLLWRAIPTGIVAFALLVWAGVRWSQDPASPAADSTGFHGATLTPEPAPQIALVDHQGREFDLHAEVAQGNVVLLFFGYTSCPDVCPMTLAHHKQVKQLLGEHAERVHFVMVSVDPERDTRERMKRYVEAFDPDFIGLTGNLDELRPVWEAYGVNPEKEEIPGSALGYAVTHPAFTYVVDRSGNLRLIHFLGTAPDAVAEDLVKLLAEPLPRPARESV